MSVSRYRIDVVTVALEALSLFDYRNRSRTLTQISEALSLSRSRAYRVLRTLVDQEFLVVNDQRQAYSLGPAAVRLGLVARNQDRITLELTSSMQALWKEFQETVNFGVLEGGSIRYLEILESPHPFRISDQVGSLVPLTSTAIGRSVLAAVENPTEILPSVELRRIKKQLDAVRRLGYAIDDEETIPGARCVGVAIRDPSGAVLGALSVSGPARRLTKALMPTVGTRLKQVAVRISHVPKAPER